MSVSVGTKVYDVSHKKISGTGWQISDGDARAALSDRVKSRIDDHSGKQDIIDAVKDLELTSFETENLKEVLESPPAETWAIGEAFAECYLEDHHNCSFPWYVGRDSKNPKGSLPGADLVGFVLSGDGKMFTFGEVKTSESPETPPKVMYGRTGMVTQIESLSDDRSKVSALIRYLGYRHKNTDWELDYQSAMKRYLKDTGEYSLFGVLVRTTTPNKKDIESRAKQLAKKNHSYTTLLCLYTSVTLPEWATLVTESREAS